MWKKLLLLVGLLAGMSIALAQEVNKADQATLDGVKGIGPKIAKTIVDERTKNGNFKDWDDFEKRVKGIGDKNAAKMSEAGLTVNGQSKPGAKTASTATKESGKTSSGSSKSSGSSGSSSSGKSGPTSESSRSGSATGK